MTDARLVGWRELIAAHRGNRASVIAAAGVTRDVLDGAFRRAGSSFAAECDKAGASAPVAAFIDAPAWQSYKPRPGWEPPVSAGTRSGAVDVERVFIIPDAHIPHHDRKAWAVAMGLLKDYRPTRIVIMGDFLSFASVSKHSKSRPDKHKIAEEYYAGNIALDEVQDAAPGIPVYYLEGNHERRTTKYVRDHEEFVDDDLFDVPVSLFINPSPRGYRRNTVELRRDIIWLPLTKYVKRCWVSPWGVGYMHSAKAESRQAGGKYQSAYHAEVVCPRSGVSIIVFAHSHTFQMYRSAAGFEAWCAGFLGNFDGDDPDPDFEYDMGPNPWATGITVQEVSGPLVVTTQVPIIGGRACFGGLVVKAA